MASIDFSQEDYGDPYQMASAPGGKQMSAAEQTYANQTEARNAYYKSNPAQAPTFAAPQQQYLNTITPQPEAPRAMTPQAPAAGGANAQAIIAQWQQTHGPHEPLDGLIAELKRNGLNADAFMYGATPSGNEISLNGQQYKVKTGDNASWYDPNVNPESPGASSYMTAFSDPSTKYMQGYYGNILDQFGQQSQAMAQQRSALQAQMPQIQQATQRLIDYLNQRIPQLQGPAYTGSEQEVLRTQMLDPIERDRTAANKRALESIGARGLTPESGIAQELTNNVNSVFDRQRAGAQGDLAYKQIAEQRSREQEAQSLLAMIPQVQRAQATGDLSFLQSLDSAVNSPLLQGVPLVNTIQQLPSKALSDALATMGMGPTTGQAFNQASQLQTSQQTNDAAFWRWFFSQFG